MRTRAGIGTIVLLVGILYSSSASADDWNGPGWYAVVTDAEGTADIHGGPFESKDACVADYNTHPSTRPDIKFECAYYATSEAQNTGLLNKWLDGP